MATAYTDLLGFALPVTGELSGTWGDVVNTSITELVEDSIAGQATASVTSGDWTLTTTGSGASNQARCAILVPTGTPGTTRNIIAPSQSKTYIVVNQSDSDVVLKGAATTGATIPAGVTSVVAWNGSDFVLASPSSGGIAYVYQTSNYTTQNGEGVLADTSGGSFTVTLPASPSVGDQCVIADAGGDFGTNNLTVGRNGSTIAGLAENLIIDIAGVSVQLVYDGTTWGVYAQVGGNGGDVVTLNGVQTLTNKTLTGSKITVSALGTLTTGTTTIDLLNANSYTATITASNTITIAFSNTPGATQSQVVLLRLTNAGSGTIVWPANSKFSGGTAPTLTTSGVDVLGVYYDLTTTTYMIFVIGLDVKVP